MNRMIVIGISTFLILGGIFGCQGFEGLKHRQSDTVYLDQWLEGYAFGKTAEALKSNSFMKDLPFLIVRAQGDAVGRDVGQEIDSLTKEIRERMIAFFLEFPEIRVIRKHPVPGIDRPYTLRELRCGRFVEPRMLLVIDIRKTGHLRDRQAVVSMRALNPEKGEWIRGFSLYQNVELTRAQSEKLETVSVDDHLQGLKYAPFHYSQRDEMSAYLAGNLSCLFSETYGGQPFSVYVDVSKALGRDRDIAWFIKKHLQFCNEIQLTTSRDNADWVLLAESKKIGAGTGLAQYWIEVYRQDNKNLIPGLATYAYFFSSDPEKPSIAGRWKIVDLPEGSMGGYLKITGDMDHGIRGDLFGRDGKSLIKRQIFITVNSRNVDWAYYDDRIRQTLQAKGFLSADGKKMSVTVSPFPSDGRVTVKELILEEAQ